MVDVTLCVDALAPHPGGIGRYTWELCKGLKREPRVSQLRFFGRNRILPDPEILLSDAPLPPRGGALQRWWERSGVNKSVVHGPNYFLPEFVRRGVITVHDLSFLRYPETHPADRIAAFEGKFTSSLRRASHVLTDTETVRREVIDKFSLAPGSVTAIPLGVDGQFAPQEPGRIASVVGQWGLAEGHYGLCVSTLEPRKKIAELIAAWEALPRTIRDSCPLVLCGGSGWRNESLREQIAAAEREGWLRYLGFVDDALLPPLYAGAALFIYPSIYEGFGLPPLEALACGAPVIVSRRSCLPEVCGEAARYFDPDDREEFAAQVERGLSDLDWRAAAQERGVARARQFTWAKCVDATAAIYERCA